MRTAEFIAARVKTSRFFSQLITRTQLQLPSSSRTEMRTAAGTGAIPLEVILVNEMPGEQLIHQGRNRRFGESGLFRQFSPGDAGIIRDGEKNQFQVVLPDHLLTQRIHDFQKKYLVSPLT